MRLRTSLLKEIVGINLDRSLGLLFSNSKPLFAFQSYLKLPTMLESYKPSVLKDFATRNKKYNSEGFINKYTSYVHMTLKGVHPYHYFTLC